MENMKKNKNLEDEKIEGYSIGYELYNDKNILKYNLQK